MVDGRRRLLVKARGLGDGEGSLTLSLGMGAAGGQSVRYDVKPLFTSIGRRGDAGLAETATWKLLTAQGDTDASAWDECHALMAGQLGMAGGTVEFAEPDLPQRWLTGADHPAALTLLDDDAAAHRPNKDYPLNDDDNMWWRGENFSQLAEAAQKAGVPTGRRVRVAHLDTGYTPGHSSVPAHMDTANQRNFVDEGRLHDATDTAPDHFANPGHGAATLALLAGKGWIGGTPQMPAIGGAPEAEIVPIRVADSVVLFYNSSIAQAFDYVHSLCTNAATAIDVVTLSMGGIASQAWAEAINALYEAGVVVVAAAGNNYGNLPTRNIVFPARFNRVIAATGVMEDHKPYADLKLTLMAGNYGPTSKMGTALGAFTPNVGWARQAAAHTIDWDGNGTSAATPQIAAAAANWIQRHRGVIGGYSQRWMRAEAVRQALFQTAREGEFEHLGRGELSAAAALDSAPLAEEALVSLREDADRAYFSIFDVLVGTGLGVAPMDRVQRQMLALEALQLAQSEEVEAALPDRGVEPEELSRSDRDRIVEALLNQRGISKELTAVLKSREGKSAIDPPPAPPKSTAFDAARIELAKHPVIRPPSRRRLQVFAVDPSLGSDFSTAAINRAVVSVRWEKLRPGPVGEYLEVVDVDPASRAAYAPVDLNNPYLLPQDGLVPSEANPQFHQQMCYAVAMRTIEHFETALGRTALWRRTTVGDDQDVYVQRLRIYPHAIRAANAYYSRDKKALLLGYFSAELTTVGTESFRGVHFAALSHDIIAHETTHALLDGLHERFAEATNPDVLAFHEAFADIVALFQHFTLPEALKHEIRKTRGDFDQQDSLLGKLAVDFGKAINGGHGALRDAIGRTTKKGKWKLATPSDNQYHDNLEPHALGSVLVSAVFAAFLTIYKARADELRRLASSGTGVLPEGDIPIGLADRLAEEASKVAEQVLRMCIRALDYCPPVDINFGDYLRAIITADRDLVPEDPRGYRAAFTAAFRDRGIFPDSVHHLSPDNLVWDPPPPGIEPNGLDEVIKKIDQTWSLSGDRKEAFKTSRENAIKFRNWIINVGEGDLYALGLTKPGADLLTPGLGKAPKIEVHSIRPARRIGPDGQTLTDLVVEITQTLERPDGSVLRGGCTMLIDPKASDIRYCITKRLDSAKRIGAQQRFHLGTSNDLRGSYFGEDGPGYEPFALLHAHRVEKHEEPMTEKQKQKAARKRARATDAAAAGASNG